VSVWMCVCVSVRLCVCKREIERDGREARQGEVREN